VDLDESEAEDFELPGADLAGEELTVSVVPMGPTSSAVTRCLLVHRRSQQRSLPGPVVGGSDSPFIGGEVHQMGDEFGDHVVEVGPGEAGSVHP
jgi:hypothetical protein